MTATSPAELQRLIAGMFDAQGWHYDLAVGPQLVEAIRLHGPVDGQRLAQMLPAAFFQRNRVPKDVVAAALERAVGGRTVAEEARMATTIVVGGNSYQVNVGAGASIVSSNLNLGSGAQITVSADADKQDVLLAVEAMVRSGLSGDWNEDAANDLAKVIDDRSDLGFQDIQKIASEVVKAERPAKDRITDFLGRIAASGLGGALSTGITAGVGEAIAHLPL